MASTVGVRMEVDTAKPRRRMHRKPRVHPRDSYLRIVGMAHFLGALLLLAAATRPHPAVPYTPAGDGVVLQRVPPASDPGIRRIATLRRALASDPADVRAADALARAYVDLGRTVGDAH